MAEFNGNMAVPGGQIGSGEAQVFNPMTTLSVLAGFQNRADQQAKLAAIERMKREAAIAKPPKPIEYPEFDVKSQGGLFQSKFAKEREALHLAGIDAVRKANGDPYQAAMITAKVNNEIAGRSAMLEAQKERFYKTAEELKKQGYNFDPDKVAYELTTTDNYLNPELNVKLIEKVKTNPANFNFAQVGEEAEKLAGKTKRKVTYADGATVEEEFPKFIRPSKKNPYAREVSVKDAVPFLMQTPAGREQLPILTMTELKAQGVDPTSVLNKEEKDLTSIQKQALAIAQKKAVEKYFAGRGDVTVVEDFQTEESKERGKKLADLQVGDKSTNALVLRGADNKIREVYLRDSVPLVSDKRPVPLSAGMKVYPVGYYSDKDAQTAQSIAGSAAKVLKTNVAAKTFIEANGVPVATSKLTIRLDDGTTRTIEKDEVISEAIEAPEILRSIPGLYEKRNGYFATPDEDQLVENEEGQIIRRNPKSTSLLGTVFIPDESAGAVRAHFGRARNRVSTKPKIGTKKY